jgi:4-hydroxybenzoate polyprenyltransferase
VLRSWKIIRPLNLVIIALVFVVIRFSLFQPAVVTYALQLSLTTLEYLLLMLSCMLIAAGGYIINDIRDLKADLINKPNKVFIGENLTAQKAGYLYMLLTILGLILGALVAFQVGNINLVGVHIVSSVLLYLYAVSLKKITLAGNLIVSLLIMISVVTPALFEPAIYQLSRPGDWYAANQIWTWVLGLAVFSFLLTLVREIIKDMEDCKGDAVAGDKSIPIVWGMDAAKGISVAVLLVITIALGFAARYVYFEYNNYYYLYIIFILLSCLGLIYRVLKAKQTQDYAKISAALKGLMLAGLLWLPISQLINQFI